MQVKRPHENIRQEYGSLDFDEAVFGCRSEWLDEQPQKPKRSLGTLNQEKTHLLADVRRADRENT